MKNEIIILDDKKQITPAELFTPSGIDKILEEIKVKTRSFVGDMTTIGGRKEIASMAYKVSRTKTALDNEGKKLTEEWSRQKSMVDSERKKVREHLDSLRDEVRKPLDEWEEAEKKRVSDRQLRLSSIDHFRTLNSSDVNGEELQITEAIKEVEFLTIFDWQEFSKKAETISEEALIHLNNILVSIKAAKAEKEELEKLRKEKEARDQKDREDRIAKDAADKAKADAAELAVKEKARVENEKLEAIAAAEKAKEAAATAAKGREDKIEADKKAAEQAKIDAENRAKKAEEEAKESAKKALEKERESVKIKAEQEAKELAKREANLKYQGKIHSEILEDLDFFIGDIELRKAIIKAIANGKVRNLKIIY